MKKTIYFLMIPALLAVVSAGVFVMHRPGLPESGSSQPASKTQVSAEQLSGGTAAAASASIPLRSDGLPGRATKGFLAIQGTYDLMFSPTYDGSGQATHPKLLYFPNGWNGYRYWLSYTPYPAMNAADENPCIVVSNDLKSWKVPKGLHNPISGVPADVKEGGHYSDSELVMHGSTMELWYRYNEGDRETKRPVYSMDYYYRRTSTDGIHWSSAELMQTSKTSLLSLAILYRNNEYQFWYVNCYSRLMYAVSRDGCHWTDTQPCQIQLTSGYTPWHQDVIYYNDKYYLLQTGKYQPKYSFALFLSESSDGLHFSPGTPFYPSDNSVILHKTWLYRSTMVPLNDGTFDMIVSYCLPGDKWFMTQFTLPVSEWNSACETNQELILKAPKSSPAEKAVKLASGTGGGAKAAAKAAVLPRAKPAARKTTAKL